MGIRLQTPNPPVNMLSGYVSQQEMRFAIYCYDKTITHVTTSDRTGQPLFRAEGGASGRSWSWRRKVRDSSSDRRLFDFRCKPLGIRRSWVADSLESGQLCSFVYETHLLTGRRHVDATLRTIAGEDVLVTMRPDRYRSSAAIISAGGMAFAAIRSLEYAYLGA